jgi:hypothetical protein
VLCSSKTILLVRSEIARTSAVLALAVPVLPAAACSGDLLATSSDAGQRSGLDASSGVGFSSSSAGISGSTSSSLCAQAAAEAMTAPGGYACADGPVVPLMVAFQNGQCVMTYTCPGSPPASLPLQIVQSSSSPHATGTAGPGGSLSASPTDAAVDVQATCVLSAAKYDQTCTTDSDCVELIGDIPVVFDTNLCQPACICPTSAINVAAQSRYAADFSNTPLGSGAIPQNCDTLGIEGGCATPVGPCCRNGQCTVGLECD